MTKLGQGHLSLPLLESSFLSTNPKSAAAEGERTADLRPRWPLVPIGGVPPPPLGHSPPQHAWVCAVLSGFSLRIHCSVLALCLLSPLPSVQHARCSLKRSTSHPLPSPYPFALSTPVTTIIAGRQKRKLCPQPPSPLSPYLWRRHPHR